MVAVCLPRRNGVHLPFNPNTLSTRHHLDWKRTCPTSRTADHSARLRLDRSGHDFSHHLCQMARDADHARLAGYTGQDYLVPRRAARSGPVFRLGPDTRLNRDAELPPSASNTRSTAALCRARGTAWQLTWEITTWPRPWLSLELCLPSWAAAMTAFIRA